jgi:hypothetical protein
MDRSLVQAKQGRSDTALSLRSGSAGVAFGCVRSWRERRNLPHAGYVGWASGFAGTDRAKLRETTDPVAGPIEPACLRDVTLRVGMWRGRPPGGSFHWWRFDAPRDLSINRRRSFLR